MEAHFNKYQRSSIYMSYERPLPAQTEVQRSLQLGMWSTRLNIAARVHLWRIGRLKLYST